MDTQLVSGPLETQVEMMELLRAVHASSHAVPCRCLKFRVTLFTTMIVIAGLAGIIAYQFFNPVCEKDSMPVICLQTDFQHDYVVKQNPKDTQMWDIFTTHKEATYLIHGKVTCEDKSKDSVYLDHVWKRGESKSIEVGKCPELHFTEVVKLFPNSDVYLFFNLKGERPRFNQTIKVYQLGC